MEGGEAAPRAVNKEKKNKENNSRIYYGIYLLALILYYFFYLIGLIHIMGYIIKAKTKVKKLLTYTKMTQNFLKTYLNILKQ